MIHGEAVGSHPSSDLGGGGEKTKKLQQQPERRRRVIKCGGPSAGATLLASSSCFLSPSSARVWACLGLIVEVVRSECGILALLLSQRFASSQMLWVPGAAKLGLLLAVCLM